MKILERMLAEISVAKTPADVVAIVERANETISYLPPQQREIAKERILDAVRETNGKF